MPGTFDRKRSEAARARSFGRAMMDDDRKRLLDYASDLENEASDLGRRAEDAEHQGIEPQDAQRRDSRSKN